MNSEGGRTTNPWVSFVLAFVALYAVIAVVMFLSGSGAAQALGTPAAILIGPAVGIGVVRYRKTR
ncbi:MULTISPECIES: hypothetical protein [Streptomyces]|uniref:Uncharacterized protein n=1 Tax=Streptomyces koelreuteriae TaxID=2838015 RepID=A0ABX8G2Q5_9ACTN|nr:MULTISPECIES: hypothetical protein [Streptomyces]QWB27756.1 hypothetical protein KJK29_37020 [Streptomyces koelreuteriae]UUA10856.1 hypothetical protein NNW98_37235 [Streptomyces koelreuteriae]UUA18462.1 hypothetical protein NNW99_37120 [Streptomyces sp. CRCS-T-1]